MATELRAFLAELATDPKRLAEFMAGADAVMEKAELAEDDRKLLKSGNLAAIQARLAGLQSGAAAPQIVVVVGLEQLQRMYTDAMRATAPAGAVLGQMPAGAAPGATLWQLPMGAVPGAALGQMPAGAAPGAALWQLPMGAVPGAAALQMAQWQPALPFAPLPVAFLMIPLPFWWR